MNFGVKKTRDSATYFRDTEDKGKLFGREVSICSSPRWAHRPHLHLRGLSPMHSSGKVNTQNVSFSCDQKTGFVLFNLLNKGQFVFLKALSIFLC